MKRSGFSIPGELSRVRPGDKGPDGLADGSRLLEAPRRRARHQPVDSRQARQGVGSKACTSGATQGSERKSNEASCRDTLQTLVHWYVRLVILPEDRLRLPPAAGVGLGDAHGPAEGRAVAGISPGDD